MPETEKASFSRQNDGGSNSIDSSENCPFDDEQQASNPLEDDFHSETNHYGYDPTSSSLRILGYEINKHPGVCNSFRQGYCKYGSNCLFKHVPKEESKLLIVMQL